MKPMIPTPSAWRYDMSGPEHYLYVHSYSHEESDAVPMFTLSQLIAYGEECKREAKTHGPSMDCDDHCFEGVPV